MTTATRSRDLVFVNNTRETFTPTQSGALATYIEACCRAADRTGRQPLVVSRRAPVPPFDWPRTVLIDFPPAPRGAIGDLLTRVQRKTTGWPVLRQRAWVRHVITAIQREKASDGTLLLQNDPEVAVRMRALLPSARLVHLFHNQLPAREPFRRRLGKAVDVVAAVSDFTARWVEEYYSLQRGSVVTVLSGVDSSVFRPDGPRDAPPVIGFVGRTGIEKAPDILLEASLMLAEQRRDFEVQIVGSNHWDRFERDPYQDHLDELAAQLSHRGVTVSRPGHVGRAELPRLLGRTTIHVVPSRWDEPFGLTTLEGMAAGNVVIATRTGGTPEVLGDAGFLVERDDPGALHAVLGRLLDDPALRAEYSARARSRALELSWTRTWSQLSHLAG